MRDLHIEEGSAERRTPIVPTDKPKIKLSRWPEEVEPEERGRRV